MLIVAFDPLLLVIVPPPAPEGNVTEPPEKLTNALLIGESILFLRVLGLEMLPDPTVTTRLGVDAAMSRPGTVSSLLIDASVLSIPTLAAELS
jgi:hypothetical protein